MSYTLLRKALALDPGRSRTSITLVTDDEIELYLAYVQGEVTGKQCVEALGRSYGYFVNWYRRCTTQLYLQGHVQINWDNSMVKFKKKTYEEAQAVYTKGKSGVVERTRAV